MRFLTRIVAVLLCVGCQRTHQLRFADVVHLRAREISPVEVVVSGDLGSSGQCVESVVEKRHGDNTTLIVLLKIADGHCDSRFERRVDTRGVSAIYLGRHFILNGPDETGLVWHR